MTRRDISRERSTPNRDGSPVGSTGDSIRDSAAAGDSTAAGHPAVNEDLADDPRVVALLEEYLTELQTGGQPNRAAYLSRYPELTPVVSECLDGIEWLHTSSPADGLRRSTNRPAFSTPDPAVDPAVDPAADPAADPLASTESGTPPQALGDFQILREIARGGMGIVYEAIQLSLGRRVALKVLPFAATFDSRHLQRFKNEAQAAALLHHTHIVPIYAVGCERGVHFYAMQLIDGQSLAVVIEHLRHKQGLRSAVKNPPPLTEIIPRDRSHEHTRLRSAGTSSHPARQTKPSAVDTSTAMLSATLTSQPGRSNDERWRRSARLMFQAAEALHYAHQEGIIHRDIKPANLLLDAAGELWITDFGLAQLQRDNGLTRSGDIVGTFRYMSPEQTSGERTMLDHRTDLYSLGATFYELLTLEPVFPGESHQELIYQILHVEPRRLKDLDRAIPFELETIVLKTLQKNAAERYPTAGELAADIQRYLSHEPIKARRASAADRFKKWTKRHPSIVIAAVITMVIVTVLTLIDARRLAWQQAQTAAALSREQLRAAEAEQRFQQARKAVDTLFQISEEELADRPLDQARVRILEVVLGHYEDFIDQRKNDPVATADLARMQERVKTILRELQIVHREFQRELLSRANVRDALKLSSDQQAKLSQQLDLWNEERHTHFEAFHQLTEDQRRQRMVTIGQTHDRELKTILSPDQLTRFRQVTLRIEGLFAFQDPDVVERLELTDEQRSAIRVIEREALTKSSRFGGDRRGGPGRLNNEGFGAPFDQRGGPEDGGRHDRPAGRGGPDGRGGPEGRGGFGGRGGPGGRPDWPVAQQQEAVQKVLALLTGEQRAIWQTMIGEPLVSADNELFSPGFSPGPPR